MYKICARVEKCKIPSFDALIYSYGLVYFLPYAHSLSFKTG